MFMKLPITLLTFFAAISNKVASGTHFHLDTLIAVVLKWAVAPTTKTDGFFVFNVDAEPCIDGGHGGGKVDSEAIIARRVTIVKRDVTSAHAQHRHISRSLDIDHRQLGISYMLPLLRQVPDVILGILIWPSHRSRIHSLKTFGTTRCCCCSQRDV